LAYGNELLRLRPQALAAVEALAAGGVLSREQLAKAITSGFVYDGQRSPFRRRQHGAPVGDDQVEEIVNYLVSVRGPVGK